MASPGLMDRLREADRAWRRNRSFESFLRSVKFLCAILVLVVALDLLLQLSAVPRLTILIVAAIALLVFLLVLARHAWGKSRSLLPVARHLEDRDKAFGSKLVNLIQLREQAEDPALPALTRALATRAVEDSGSAVEPSNFLPLTKSPTIRRSLGLAALPVVLLLIPVALWAPIAVRELLRFVDPFGDHPPFSFTSLRIVAPDEEDSHIVFRRPVTIEVEFTGHRPKELFLTVKNTNGSGNEQTIPMFPLGDNRFVQQIDEVKNDLTVRAHNKSGRAISEGRKISVILTPQLEGARVAVAPPAYTRIARRETNLSLGKPTAPTVSVLKGSKLVFSLDSNRPLSAGSVGLQSASPGTLEIPMPADKPDHPSTALAELVATESGRLHFDLRDETGLPADRELVANLVVTHDLPPEVEITEPATDGFIVDTFAANIAVRSSDDYGLANLRIHSAINDAYAPPKHISMQSAPPRRDALETIRIAPSEQGAVPGDVIQVFAEATDIRPDPQMSRSRTLRLEVISEDQYNDFLRTRTEIRDLEAKYSTLHEELRELARQQRDLAEKAATAGDSSETRDKLAAQQSELNSKLDKLAEKMESATRKNPLYDLERDLQRVLDREATRIRESIAMNGEGLEAFLAAEPSAESRAVFEKEATAQADRLDPMREAAESQIAKALEDADLIQQLLKPLTAYHRLYEMQQELASQTAAYKANPSPTDDDRLALQQMAATERLVGKGLEEIARQLREAAENAREAYPKAAQDAENIAAAIERANLAPLADRSAMAMATGRGNESHNRAEHLRAEMEQLMSQCGQCQGKMAGEFALRLRLMHQMLAGNTFSQMAQCQNFGLAPGMSGMGGSGMGLAGSFGMGSSQSGPSISLLGGESMLGQNAREESATASGGRADSMASPNVALSDNRGNSDEEPQRLDRPSHATAGDAIIQTYDDVVEAYFKKLTAPGSRNP